MWLHLVFVYIPITTPTFVPADPPSSPRGNWEDFGDAPSKSKKLMSAGKDRNSGGGAVCAADAVMSDATQWTALGDSHGYAERVW